MPSKLTDFFNVYCDASIIFYSPNVYDRGRTAPDKLENVDSYIIKYIARVINMINKSKK